MAFGVYQIKAWKKNRQGKAQIRKNRSNAKASLKSKTDKTKAGSDPNYAGIDTSSYGKGDPFICTTIKVVFFKKAKVKRDQTDTLTIGFIPPNNELNQLDEVQIRGYLYKNNRDHIIKIKLCDCDKNENEVSKAAYLQRSAQLTKYLKANKIPKKKIELE